MRNGMMAWGMAMGLLAGPAAAEEKAVMAECGSAGCTCTLTAVTQSEMAVVYGMDAAPSPDSVLVLAEDQAPAWSAVSADELDLLYGGDGQCTLQLFPDLVPKDGLWEGRVEARTITGCPPAMAPALETATSAMVMSRRISWGGRFDPDKLRDPAAADSAFVWSDRGGGAWTGTGKFNRQSGPLGLDMQSTARIVAEDLAHAGMRISVSMAAADAQAKAILKAAGLTNCRVEARYVFRHVGD